ncbi:MAG: hypothetical protein PUH96_11645 [Coriobacteriaceae bacterium]|nr:hypothetical protein [Coriobacteriaceae bacterium]MDY5808346.1 hypothetical protein [Coriobacteriales bacterium]
MPELRPDLDAHVDAVTGVLGIHSKQELLDVVEGSAGCVSNE